MKSGVVEESVLARARLEAEQWVNYEKELKNGGIMVGDYTGWIPKPSLRIFIMFSGDFGVKVVDNMVNASGHCTPCSHLCIDKQCKYDKYSFSENIDGVVEIPPSEALPTVIDEPYMYLPKTIPSVDIMIATGLHNDLYVELPDVLRRSDVKGLIILRDQVKDAPLGVIRDVYEKCVEYGIEVAAPKPACSLRIDNSKPLIKEFIKQFRIGTPLISLNRKGETISSIKVHVAAPCGITYYVARQLLGYNIKNKENWLRKFYDKIALHHHSYPCTGSMENDIELGDTILHWGSYIEREAYLVALKLNKELTETIIERLTPKK